MNDVMTLVEGFLTLDPENPYLHLLLATAFNRLGRVDEAIVEYSHVIELSPRDISAFMNRGEIYLKQGKLLECAADLKAAINLDQDKNDPAAIRAAILLQMTSGALRLAEEKGLDAVDKAHDQIKHQIKQS